jgi:hypothetical protein
MRDWRKLAESDQHSQVQKDMKKLRELVAEFDKLDVTGDENMEKHAKAFRDMLYRMETGRLQTLTDTARNYLKDLHERLVGEPEYENLFSRGLVPKGKAVEKPAVLQKLPLKPPGKKQEWKEDP